MKIYNYPEGNIAQLRWDGTDPDYFKDILGTTLVLEFDETTNSELTHQILENYNGYSVVSGALYLNDNPVTVNPPSEEFAAMQSVKIGYPLLPNWAKTGTADQVETYLTEQIFNGQTQAQVEAWIDANIMDITTANVSQINIRLATIRQGLKLAAGAIITMRGLFILTAKLLIYIRDLVIRFRRSS